MNRLQRANSTIHLQIKLFDRVTHLARCNEAFIFAQLAAASIETDDDGRWRPQLQAPRLTDI